MTEILNKAFDLGIDGTYKVRSEINPFLNDTDITVRIDVDGPNSVGKISIQKKDKQHQKSTHQIAEIVTDSVEGSKARVISGSVIYAYPEGTSVLPVGTQLAVHKQFDNEKLVLKIKPIIGTSMDFHLEFVSEEFGKVHFDISITSDTSKVYHHYKYKPNNILSIERVFEDVGFSAKVNRPDPKDRIDMSKVPLKNSRWTTGELHNAMWKYWKNDTPSIRKLESDWAMWFLYAKEFIKPEQPGIMFDDIGPKNRQGAALFTDSIKFTNNLYTPQTYEGRSRNQFFTTIHEIGHGFNLLHSWQKLKKKPWITDLTSSDQSLSFMNYSEKVTNFYRKFMFKFTDEELIFLRHAPREFVTMGRELFGINHGYVIEDRDINNPDFKLLIQTTSGKEEFLYMEPVSINLKLINMSNNEVDVDANLLKDAHDLQIIIEQKGVDKRYWYPMAVGFGHQKVLKLKNGDNISGHHTISYSPAGWLIHEPGEYTIKAIVNVNGNVISSDPMQINVIIGEGFRASHANGYFEEEVGRALYFRGGKSLDKANQVLLNVFENLKGNPASIYAIDAILQPILQNYKEFDFDTNRMGPQIAMDPIDYDAANYLLSQIHTRSLELSQIDGNVLLPKLIDSLTKTLSEEDAEPRSLILLQKSRETVINTGASETIVKKIEKRIQGQISQLDR